MSARAGEAAGGGGRGERGRMRGLPAADGLPRVRALPVVPLPFHARALAAGAPARGALALRPEHVQGARRAARPGAPLAPMEQPLQCPAISHRCLPAAPCHAVRRRRCSTDADSSGMPRPAPASPHAQVDAAGAGSRPRAGAAPGPHGPPRSAAARLQRAARRRGARAARATRWWMRACASCGAPAGCTTARVSCARRSWSRTCCCPGSGASSTTGTRSWTPTWSATRSAGSTSPAASPARPGPAPALQTPPAPLAAARCAPALRGAQRATTQMPRYLCSCLVVVTARLHP